MIKTILICASHFLEFSYNKMQILKTLTILILATTIISACGGGSSSNSNSNISTTQLNLNSNPSEISSGQTSLITWQTQNIVSCRADGGWTSDTNANASVTVGPLTNNSTFTLSCLDQEGGSITRTTTVTVSNTTPSPTLSLTASPAIIDQNESSTISWSTRNVDSCNALNGWTSSNNANGSSLINSITNSTTYSMRCTGPGGSTTNSVNVTVNSPAPVPDPAPVPTPELTLTASATNIDANTPVTISWSSINTDSCTAEGSWTNQTITNGSQNFSPSTTREYRMTCLGNGSSVTRSITITVNPVIADSAELSWEAPSTNQDGSTLTDLAGYVIHYGTNRNNLNQTININNAGLTTYIIDDLPAATYFFAITARDNNGNESLPSNIASQVIR